MSYFDGQNLELIEALIYNPNAKPSYDVIRDCLIWEDEIANNLNPDGYEKLGDLWIIRSFIHRKIPSSRWGLDPEYFQKAWNNAVNQNFRWPGFFRLKLSKSDQEYYQRKRYEIFETNEI